MILGMKVRKQDLEDMLNFKPKILEFHFSDSDINLELTGNFEQKLIVHCYEYFEKKLLDIVSLGETNQIHSQEKSIELVQKAIGKTLELGQQFQGKPTIIVHPGGYSMKELEEDKIKEMKDGLIDAVNKLDISKVDFLLENMPPYAWFFGGRWISNSFLDSKEMISYNKKTNLPICYDICHSQLYCNKNKKFIVDELKAVEDFVDHFHLSDAGDVDGEGLQFGEGDLPFEQVIPILNKHNDKSFAIEVWRGHENKGKGFAEFLTRIKKMGLIIN